MITLDEFEIGGLVRWTNDEHFHLEFLEHGDIGIVIGADHHYVTVMWNRSGEYMHTYTYSAPNIRRVT